MYATSRQWLLTLACLTALAPAALGASWGLTEAAGSQFVLLDTTYTHNTDTMAFSFFSLPSGVPSNWKLPINHAEGDIYMRLEVRSKPSSKDVFYQLCIFQDEHTSDKHACTDGPTFSSTGVHTWDQPLTSMWQYSVIAWERALLDTMLVVKDGAGNPVDTRYGFDGEWDGSPDLSLYYPMDVHFAAIVVPAGEAFIPPPGWYGGTPAPTSTPAPTPTPAPTAQPGLSFTHLSSKSGDLPAPGPATEQTASLVLDIDRDGRNDFVVGARKQAPALLWYRRLAAGWEKYVIEPDMLNIEAGGAYQDIDADGDLDIVMGGDYQSNDVWWWENPYPDFQPDSRWTRRLIKDSGSNTHHDQVFGDFDADGRAELAFWNQGAKQLLLAEIPADSKAVQPWPAAPIYTWSSGENLEGLAAVDIDGDGQLDLVGGGRWFKRSGSSFSANVIDDTQRGARTAVGQLKPGGRPEVVFVAGDAVGRLKWYEWDNSAWVGHDLLGADVDHGHSLEIADINSDGSLDIFSAEMRLDGSNPDAKTWLFLGDGQGNFSRSEVAVGIGNHESRLADLDGDGDLDILGKPYNWDTPRLDLWLNNARTEGVLPLDRWQRHLIDGSLPANSVFVEAGDLDGDQRLDLVAGSWWWKNPGSLGESWGRRTIGVGFNNLAVLHDFDRDSDLDLFGTEGTGSSANHTLVWARNDGSGNFSVLSNVDSGGSGDFLQGCAVADFGAGLQIALSWHNEGGGVHAVAVPAEPASTHWPFSTLSATTQGEDLSAGDIDRDGDLDLLLGTIWLRNDRTSWKAFTLGEIMDLDADAQPDRNALIDINLDGRLDAVVGLEDGMPLLWFEAPADPTGQWTRHLIAEVPGQGFSLDAADFDRDGDADVVMGEHKGASRNRVLLFENLDRGASWRQIIIDDQDAGVIDHHDGTQAVDLDGDGDLDLISVGWTNRKIWVFENKAVDASAPPSLPAPAISPPGGTYVSSVTVSLTTSTPGTTIRYTLDGQEPTAASTAYTGPMTLRQTTTVKARAFKSGFQDSAVTSALFTVTPASGARVTDRLLVLYEFGEGSGLIVRDSSGVGAPLDLAVADGTKVAWGEGHLVVNGATLIASTGAAGKVIGGVKATNALTLEAWVEPASASQNGPARIVTVSADPYIRNVTLGQGVSGGASDLYDMRLRTSVTGQNGVPSLSTPAGALTTRLSHVVLTREVTGAARIYLDGVERASGTFGGDLANWDDSFRLGLANELSGDRPWLGTFHLVALYDRALTPAEVVQNFNAGADPAPPPVFSDVPVDHPYFADIEVLYRAGYTAGCATDPLRFCPDAAMNRAESAVFVERGIHGTDGLPSQPTTQTFADLPLDSWAAKWAEALWVDGYTAGCGTNPLIYCPWQGHTRAEGCVFYLSMLNGPDYLPPQPSQQIFADVALDTWYAKWVQAAYDAGLLEPCQTSPELHFCPNDPLTRGLAAYMMVRAKGLPLQ